MSNRCMVFTWLIINITISLGVLIPNKKRSDGGFNCIYRCPLKFNTKTRKREYRVENNNVGPGFSCPSVMNVLRR